jgi:divalent metal cation (Fe/Co/Zn/Cd) transporter
VDDHLSLQQAHEMATHIEGDLSREIPDIEQVYVHLESRGTGIGDGLDVTHRERALVERIKSLTDEIAGPSRCHDVRVLRHGGKMSVSLHCHFEKDLSIMQIHDLTSRIEVSLKEKIPELDRCVVHAEPATV